jgi:hypothetical protein
MRQAERANQLSCFTVPVRDLKSMHTVVLSRIVEVDEFNGK